MGEPSRAVDILEGLAAKDPRDGETRRLLARALAADKQLEPAARRLAEAAALATDDPELAFLVATEFLWMKKAEEAERLFARVLDARPIPQTRVLIGRAYRDAGEYDRAHAALQAALRQDPRVRRAHYYLGMVMLADARTGPDRLEKAIAEFREELKIAPEDPPANDQLGLALLEAERPAEALPALEAAVRGQARPLYLLHLGRGQLALGRPAEAATSSRLALELAHQHAGSDEEMGKIHYQLGLALRKLGAAQEASQHLAEARRLAGEGPGEPAESRDEGSPLAQLPPPQRQGLKRRVLATLTQAYFNLGVLQAQSPRPAPAAERFARAAAFFERAAAIDPAFPQLQSSLGVAYFNARMFDKATDPLSRAVAASPSSADLKRLLATSWLNVGAWDKAGGAAPRRCGAEDQHLVAVRLRTRPSPQRTRGRGGAGAGRPPRRATRLGRADRAGERGSRAGRTRVAVFPAPAAFPDSAARAAASPESSSATSAPRPASASSTTRRPRRSTSWSR